MAKSSGAPHLSRRALNRALLARQMLLERQRMTALALVEHLVGMQAQVPSDPYFALWSRLKDFVPGELEGLIEGRRLVRLAAMRGTLHLLTAADALTLRTLVQPTITRLLAGTPFGRETKGLDLAAAMATARTAVDETPMTLAALRKVIAAEHPALPAHAVSYVFHYTTALIQVPPRGLWGRSGAPKVTTAEAWLGKRRTGKPAADKIVLRYLAAFGPASVMDAQAWSGLKQLRPVFEALRPRLAAFGDEDGHELFDLADAPRPEEDTPAPVRFLPTYDNVTLGFADRRRIVPERMPAAPNAWAKTFLVDGFVAGYWQLAEGKKTATLTLMPLAALKRRAKNDLAEEGQRLLVFAAPDAKGTISFAS